MNLKLSFNISFIPYVIQLHIFTGLIKSIFNLCNWIWRHYIESEMKGTLSVVNMFNLQLWVLLNRLRNQSLLITHSIIFHILLHITHCAAHRLPFLRENKRKRRKTLLFFTSLFYHSSFYCNLLVNYSWYEMRHNRNIHGTFRWPPSCYSCAGTILVGWPPQACGWSSRQFLNWLTELTRLKIKRKTL
jgi:hypothetical protein